MTDTGAFPQILELNDPTHHEALERLSAFEADVAVVCCYPRRIPLETLNVTRLGGLNVHPSLLPEYRGPDPLFWIYRNGQLESGVTIHQVDAGLDTGPIVHQERFEITLGAPGDETWRYSSEVGARLMAEAIDMLAQGSARPQVQGQRGSYFSWPVESDLVVKPDEWEAWRVFHFCRGVLPLGHVLRIELAGTSQKVTSVLDYAATMDPPTSHPRRGEWVQCAEGWTLLELEPNTI